MDGDGQLFARIAAALTEAEQVSRAWLGKAVQTPEQRERNTGWMPFNLYDFGQLLLAAQSMAPGRRLLEIGCGPGPNLILAGALGWDALGIEIHEDMADAARELGLAVAKTDALTWTQYGLADAVWFNRALRDAELQAGLEAKVWAEMKPGAVVLCANLEHPPPVSWFPVDDSWGTEPEGLRRGVWLKPYPVPDLA